MSGRAEKSAGARNRMSEMRAFRAELVARGEDPRRYCRWTRQKCDSAFYCAYSLAMVSSGDGSIIGTRADFCMDNVSRTNPYASCSSCGLRKTGRCRFPESCLRRRLRRLGE